LRDCARQAETEKANGEFRAAQTHEDSQSGKATSSYDYQPGLKEKVAARGYQRRCKVLALGGKSQS
jgi:hypothetical protein